MESLALTRFTQEMQVLSGDACKWVLIPIPGGLLVKNFHSGFGTTVELRAGGRVKF